ncbi:MAG: hypothetical protein Edafosvirus34_2 [Edafosvirus sp.]|uniref:SHSP domain-containing protein n=1 Tax=Edafosvirus sp. TaxID=2487765 RepID=A0A3G4ZV46_9VIRU|nr:MAG: hypothetical protein Edafosvirus34_2 [Edafosvirus sp.]
MAQPCAFHPTGIQTADLVVFKEMVKGQLQVSEIEKAFKETALRHDTIKAYGDYKTMLKDSRAMVILKAVMIKIIEAYGQVTLCSCELKIFNDLWEELVVSKSSTVAPKDFSTDFASAMRAGFERAKMAKPEGKSSSKTPLAASAVPRPASPPVVTKEEKSSSKTPLAASAVPRPASPPVVTKEEKSSSKTPFVASASPSPISPWMKAFQEPVKQTSKRARKCDGPLFDGENNLIYKITCPGVRRANIRMSVVFVGPNNDCQQLLIQGYDSEVTSPETLVFEERLHVQRDRIPKEAIRTYEDGILKIIIPNIPRVEPIKKEEYLFPLL